MPTDAQQALKTLAELVASDDCVLFLGNDLPVGYPKTAPPSRDELAAALAADLDAVSFPTQGNLAKIARLYEGSRDHNALVRRVIELTDPARPAQRRSSHQRTRNPPPVVAMAVGGGFVAAAGCRGHMRRSPSRASRR